MVARELTKLHEELRAGTLDELAGYYSEHPPRGELTVVVEGTGTPAEPPDRTGEAVEQATQLLAAGHDPPRGRPPAHRDASAFHRNDAYRLVMELP